MISRDAVDAHHPQIGERFEFAFEGNAVSVTSIHPGPRAEAFVVQNSGSIRRRESDTSPVCIAEEGCIHRANQASRRPSDLR